MARSPYQTTLGAWQKRVQQVRSRNLPDSLWKELAQKDISNVLQGHTPMSDAEVSAAFMAGAGNPLIKDPQAGSSLVDIPGNIASDVQGLVTDFIPGVAGYVTSLPEQLHDFVKLAQNDPATQQKYGMEVGGEGGIGGFVRNMSRTPVFGPLIPGLHTAAATTTPEGRTTLAQHPASTFVDVLPVASEAGKLATAGKVAEEGSATALFQQRRPLRGAIVAGAEQVSKLPGMSRFSRAAYNQSLLDAGLHPQIVETLSKPLEEIKAGQQREMRDFIQGDLFQSMKDLTDEQRRTLSDAAQNPGVNRENILALPPEHQAILGNVEAFNKANQLSREGNGLFTFKGPDGKLHTYSDTEPVVKDYVRAGRANDLATKAAGKLDEIITKREARTTKLEGRYGKVRKFREDDATFAAREAGPVTTEAIRTAAVPLVESFRDLDPLTVYGEGIFKSGMTQQALTAVLRDVKALSGEEGLLAKWDQAMMAGDIPGARKLLTQVKQRFNHNSWDRTPYGLTFRTHILDLQREMVGIQRRMRGLGYGMKTVKTALRDERRALARAQTTAQVASSATKKYMDTIVMSPEAAYHPLIAQGLRETAMDAAHVKYAANAEELDAALNSIQGATDFRELEQWLGEAETKAMIAEAKSQWLALSASGVDPIFVHNVSAASLQHVTRPSVLPNRFYTPGVVKQRIFNIGDSVHDVLASVTDYKRQLISEAGTERFVTEHVSQWVKDELDVKRQLREAMAGAQRRGFLDLDALVQREIAAHYVKFDPERYGFAKYYPGAQGKQLLIPKGVDRALSTLMRDNKIPVEGVYDNTIKLWKMSVLTTPRHLSHVALGGAMMGLLREPGFLRQLTKASRIVKADSADFLTLLSRNVNDLTPDQLFHFSSGRTIGRMLAETAGRPSRALNRLEEHAAATLKVSGMLSAEARGLSRDAAIRLANKVFVDMNAMTPFERVVMRKVFPFYGFTRHLGRYLLTYPFDHPLRASILSNLANQQRADWASGLPQGFSMLFFLGAPDEAGNVNTIDYRSIDPFRSFFNEFTLAGITSQLNPIAQTTLQMMGVNVLAATPELYPESHYDPELGTIVASRPSDSPIATVVHSIIPETIALDALIGITDRYRHLKDTNKRSYHKAIFTALGIPFEYASINVPLEKEDAAVSRFNDAQHAISQALISNDFNDVKRYNAVPVPSLLRKFLPGRQYASPAEIEALWGALTALLARQGAAGVSPKAILPKS